MGQGDAMADALVHASLADFGPGGFADLGASVGLDRAAFQKCMDDPETLARVKADQQLFVDIGGGGVPRLFIGEVDVRGFQDEEQYERLLARAFK